MYRIKYREEIAGVTNLSFEELWRKTRAGAKAGRGFRYQDAVGAWLVAEAWSGKANWNYIIPEGVDDITVHGRNREIRAQVKSRHKPNSEFEIREIADFIIKVYENLGVSPQGVVPEIAIVLERPVNGITATGFDVTLLDSGQNIDCLKQELSSRNDIASDIVELILGKTHIVCEEFPIEKAIGLFQDDVNISPATARILIQRVRELVGITSDENYLASFKAPKEVGISDLQEALEHINSIFDNGSHTSIIEEVCEIANFSTPLNDNDFYFGVDVMPGHVGQGLIFERQQEISDALNSLHASNIALICGPSGAGKSAIAWSCAYETRHFVRWYRVKGLSQATAQKLLQASKILDATKERPVGFVLDDVGKSTNNFWDDFVTEINAHSGIYLIGTIREEDTFALASFSTIPVIRPKFGEDLAEQIWSQLQQRGMSEFSYWREPFMESEGLLLEYIHMLTQGNRLSDTLREQIRRRIFERRDDELEILRIVSFATYHGASILSTNLKNYLGMTSTRFAAALNRL